jgi:hypothetical protein
MKTEIHSFFLHHISFFVIISSSSSSLFGFDLLDGVVSMSNFVSVHDVDELTYDDDDDAGDEENMTAVVENENLISRGNSDNSGASIVRSGTSRSSSDSVLAETLSEWSLPSVSTSSLSPPPTLASNESSNRSNNTGCYISSGTNRSHQPGGSITILSSAPTNETPTMFSMFTAPPRQEYHNSLVLPRFGGGGGAPPSDLSLSLTTAASVYTDAGDGFGSSPAHFATFDGGSSSSCLSLNPLSLPIELIISLPDSFFNHERRCHLALPDRHAVIDPPSLPLAVDLLSSNHRHQALNSSFCATVEDDASRHWDNQSDESQTVVTISSENCNDDNLSNISSSNSNNRLWYAKLQSEADWEAFQEEARRLLAALEDSATLPPSSGEDDSPSLSQHQLLSPDEFLSLLIQREEEIFWSDKKKKNSSAATTMPFFFAGHFSWTASTVTAAVVPLLAFALLNNRR